MNNQIFNITKIVLITVLLTWAISGIFIGMINAEAFILGSKVNGDSAWVFLITGGIIGFVISVLIWKKPKIGSLLSIGYFMFYLINSILLVQNYFFFGIPEIVIVGLILSVLLLVVNQRYSIKGISTA